MRRPTIAVDFDGVLHRYDSGWQGARNIPDPPVEGAMRWLLDVMDQAEVQVVSSRARSWGGRHAIQRWLQARLAEELHALERAHQIHALPDHAFDAFMGRDMEGRDPWETAKRAARDIVRGLRVTATKPGAVALLDDRAVRFDGYFPRPEHLMGLKPWNRQ